MRDVEFLVVGCGPAGGTAAREAARSGAEVLVLERDPVVGAKRVCAAGLRPGFLRAISICRARSSTAIRPSSRSTRRPAGATTSRSVRRTRRPAKNSTARSPRSPAAEGAEIRTGALFRDADPRRRPHRRRVRRPRGRRARARCARGRVFLAQGSGARLEGGTPFALRRAGATALLPAYQYRVYLERPALPVTYETLEMHYYLSAASGRNVIAWMFPKRDHLSIGLGITGKIDGKSLRAELDAFLPTRRAALVRRRSATRCARKAICCTAASRGRRSRRTA